MFTCCQHAWLQMHAAVWPCSSTTAQRQAWGVPAVGILPERRLESTVLVGDRALGPRSIAGEPPASLVVLAADHAPVQQQPPGVLRRQPHALLTSAGLDCHLQIHDGSQLS
jgi:hypothetical protein